MKNWWSNFQWRTLGSPWKSLLFEHLFLLPLLIWAALRSRAVQKAMDVGIGPIPIVTHGYHKRAIQLHGWSAETFVNTVYFITSDFDVRLDQKYEGKAIYEFVFRSFRWITARYRCLYFYFNGCILMQTKHMWRFEPWLLKLAGIKVVVYPYGGDVQEISRCSNLLYKNAISTDYPLFKEHRSRISESISRWTLSADHVIGGCDWVDYMFHWDSLMTAHFCLDAKEWKPLLEKRDPAGPGPLRVMHAPNHRTIKGTKHFIRAIEELRAEGCDIELVIREKVPNSEIKNRLAEVDVVADQLIIGWYGHFAVEAMAMGKPVLCYLRDEFVQVFEEAGIIEHGEPPVINCNFRNLKETLRDLLTKRETLRELGVRAREYVLRQHSIEAIGEKFRCINEQIGLRRRDIASFERLLEEIQTASPHTKHRAGGRTLCDIYE